MKVLVLEDDTGVRKMLEAALTRRGLFVVGTASVAEAREKLRQLDFDIVVLDLVLPDGSGLEILGELRESGSTSHVIVLSGASSERDRVGAFTLGADDYVVKPISMSEFTARVLAVRRRLSLTTDKRLTVGHLDMDLAARSILVRGSLVAMTSKEFDLLAFLAARPGVTFSRADLLRSVWDSAPGWQSSSTVTEHVRRVRSKIEDEPRKPTLIVTVRGSGYRLDAPHARTGGLDACTGNVVHLDGRIVFADPDALRIIGGDEASVLDKHLFEFVAPTSQRAAEHRMQVTESGEMLRSELMDLRRLDGASVSVEVSSSTSDWNGERAGCVRFTPVAEPPTRLRQLATGIATEVSDAVIVTDIHSHVRSWNAAAASLYGWSEDEVLGRHVLDVVHVPVEDESVEVWDALATEGHWHGEIGHMTRDGSKLNILAAINLICDDGGAPLGVVSVNRLAPAVAEDEVQPSGLVGEMRRGIDHHEFEVFYQPVVDVADGMFGSFEALVRWNHPDRGLLGPDDFLAVAEASGLIDELGDVVLRQACRQAASWRTEGYEIQVAVNISAHELADVSLPRRVATALQQAGLEASALWLEVTETGLVMDVAEARHVLERLAMLGVGIALDDFGTGWASLTYLKEFPVQVLKIDRSFIGGLAESTRSLAIARSILAIGAELNLLVVAEGVETIRQQEILQGLGCTLAQGYLYGRPTPADEAPMHRARRTQTPRSDDAQADALPSTETNPRLGRRRHLGAVEVSEAGSNLALLEPAPSTKLFAESTPDAVSAMLKALLRARSTDEAIELLHRTVRKLGGTLVPASSSCDDTLPIELSFGEGPALVVAVEPFSVARMQLERILPGLAEDTRTMVEVLRQRELPAGPV